MQENNLNLGFILYFAVRKAVFGCFFLTSLKGAGNFQLKCLTALNMS